MTFMSGFDIIKAIFDKIGDSGMSKKAKRITAVVGALCMILSVFLGVFAAKTVSGIYFGEEINLASLDNAETESIGVVNILLLGVDKGGLRSDTIMLVSLNGKTKKVNVLSIPRDTRVPFGSNYYKINAAIGIGEQEVRKKNLKEPEELTIQKVKMLTGMPIHYFMTIDFDAFIEIIDILGGVDFEIPFNMVYNDPAQNLHINLKAGMQHLNGKQAHDFVRFRKGDPGYKGYANGDLGRIEAQQAFMRALAEQKLKPQYLLKATEIFSSIKENVRTNYSAKDLLKHIGIIKDLNSEDFKMHQLPGTTQTIGGQSYVICDEAATADLVSEYFYPETEADEPSEK